MDDRSLRIAVLLSAHMIFLSAAALRILRGHREHRLVAGAPWWVQYYPPLVWLPFVVAYAEPLAIDLDQTLRYVGLAIAVVSAAFAAWAMWSLGRSYGIRMDVFEGHSLKTDGPYGLVRPYHASGSRAGGHTHRWSLAGPETSLTVPVHHGGLPWQHWR